MTKESLIQRMYKRILLTELYLGILLACSIKYTPLITQQTSFSLAFGLCLQH